jgi:hypothetical protein
MNKGIEAKCLFQIDLQQRIPQNGKKIVTKSSDLALFLRIFPQINFLPVEKYLFRVFVLLKL